MSITTIIARAVVLLICFPIHELAHAVLADRLGDPTPRRMGRITLNPLAHLDPIGSFLIMLQGFGWAKPVMVNPGNLRGNSRSSMAIVALAGPLSNLIMAILTASLFRLGIVDASSTSILSLVLRTFVGINVLLTLFNLIPVPPLDGYKILGGILPPEMAYSLQPLERYGFLILMGLIFLLPMVGIDVLQYLVFQPTSVVAKLLIG